jgi:hypothetical protein
MRAERKSMIGSVVVEVEPRWSILERAMAGDEVALPRSWLWG